jgi:DNA invertase Pin-like site-specific DNA recombinase
MGTTAYYLRTSHYLQNIGTQVDKIEEGWKVYKDEGVSGRVSFQDRPSGKKLLEDIRNGKVSRVICLRVDRLGRSTQNILETISYIHSYKVPITSLNEGITTLDENGNQTPMTGLLVNILSSLSEFFYHQTREKTMDGIFRAKMDGKYKGRHAGAVESIDKFLSKPKVKKIQELLKLNVGIRKISRIVECSPNYVYKVQDRITEYKKTG